MLVVDASAVVDLLLGTDRAADVRRGLSTTSGVHAPELLDPEVISVVRRWTHRGWVSPEVGARAVGELGELAIVRHGHAGLRERVWQLRYRCSAHDACYVALAESLGAALLTTDDRLRRAVHGVVEVVG